ncbi:S-layer family protein [Oscillatoriales cyanobacterium LEGE 11467]|uniref:S-layer family protein n=1 Tax=Zarconia navalis LEGE 11467 TaxID=1828826 RepID=A0A928VZR0_9CYAN|nr:S-layer family protein [Zarconia navalis]MBE9042599.1 S-layer family protein [Zarconia navalis LEGE 11467]
MKQADSFWLAVSVSVAGTIACPLAIAQIVPDGTLPVNSIVTPDGNTFTIEGGTAAGSNLFHSFGEFNVPANDIAHFNNDLTIENTIARVTGGNVSNIDGLIRANGTANLFLINPAGLMFGPNASLDIGGSFVGSTASAVQFEDGSFYSAVDVDAPPLLTVNVPIGLQFGPQPSAISVEGEGHRLRFEEKLLASGQETDILNREDRPPGLQVRPDRTLALVGGNINLVGGNLTAQGGRIELGSVAGNSTVILSPIASGWQLGYDGVEEFGDIRFTGAASIDTSGAGAGAVQVQGRSLYLTDGSAIVAVTLGDEAGGEVSIRTTESVEFVGTTPGGEIQTGIIADVELGATGDGGNVILETERFLARDGGFVNASTRGGGNAGTLTVEASDVILAGVRVFPSPTGSGNPDVDASGLFSQVSPGSTGMGGTIEIDANRLVVDGGAKISTVTRGEGNAGSIEIRAAESVEILTQPVARKERPLPSSLRAATDRTATGDGGDLTIHTDRLLVVGGSDLATTTRGMGNAGDLMVTANDIELRGFTFNQRERLVPSRLEAQSNTIASGNAGNLTVRADRLSLVDGAKISVEGQGTGAAGNLSIAAETVLLDDSPLSATTTQGDRGNIHLDIADLRLRNGSSITTEAQNNSDGGNITLATETLLLFEDSLINANAFEGTGGNVQIAASGIFTDRNSTITASSQRGIDGTIIINTPDVDPSNGLLELPDTPIDVTSLIGQDPCLQGSGSELVSTGRGGLPPTPREALRGDEGFVELVKLDPPDDRATREEISESEPQFDRLVEAQGWILGPDGEVILTVNPPTVIPHEASVVPDLPTAVFDRRACRF